MPGVDDLTHIVRPARGEPGGALVLFHGRGSSEHDMAGLFDVLDPDGRFLCAAPRGPLELPPGGFHWYIVPRVGYPDRDTFLSSYERLSAWLDAFAAETGIAPEETVLGGFSQGCVMAWALTLGPGRSRPGGLLAMSGFIPTVDDFPLDYDRLAGLPVAIVHGSQDPVISVEFARAARDRAEAAGADVLYRESPVPHTLDPRVLPELTAWLQERATSTP
jgi:phospholipase/carboxylesterase